MRQLIQEGWIHHVCRNSLAIFLTRGDLFISWEKGMNSFFKYLIDVKIGNRMKLGVYFLIFLDYFLRLIGQLMPETGTG